jgi:tetratricopeptide (TPR) repeat protein
MRLMRVRLLAWFLLVVIQVRAQNISTPASQQVVITVVNAAGQPVIPVKSVRVSLGYLDGSTAVTEARDVTNPRGQAWLKVSHDAAQREDLRIQITGAEGLVIYQPADGQVPALPGALTVSLLPKGSTALLGPSQIEAAIKRLSTQVAGLQRMNRGLQQNPVGQASAAKLGKDDLASALGEWARTNGIAPEEVARRVAAWADGVSTATSKGNDSKQGLAQFALRNFGSAAKLFAAAAEREDDAVTGRVPIAVAARRLWFRPLQQSLADSKRSANAYRLNGEYRQATEVTAAAVARLANLRDANPKDAEIADIWLAAVRELADAQVRESEVARLSEIDGLLAAAAKNDQTAVDEYGQRKERLALIASQVALAKVLIAQASRMPKTTAQPVYDRAVELFGNAVLSSTEDDPKVNLAALAVDYANTIRDQAERFAAAGEDPKYSSGISIAQFLLLDATTKYNDALEIYTKSDTPREWAWAQYNEGRAALDDTAIPGVSAENSIDLATNAVGHFESAFEIYTKEDYPQDWARTKVWLGKALKELTSRTEGAESWALVRSSVQAYEDALTVYNKKDVPQQWAEAQDAVAYVLYLQAHNREPTNVDFFAKAAAHFQSALEVYTFADNPSIAGRDTLEMSRALTQEAALLRGDEAVAVYGQAADAVRVLLQVRPRPSGPKNWGTNESRLSAILTAEAEQSGVATRAGLLTEAVEALQGSLEVVDKEQSADTWADRQMRLCGTTQELADASGTLEYGVLLEQAKENCGHALEVYTLAGNPKKYAGVEKNLGNVYLSEGLRGDGAAAQEALQKAAAAYQQALPSILKADDPVTFQSLSERLAVAQNAMGFHSADPRTGFKPVALSFSATSHEALIAVMRSFDAADFAGCLTFRKRIKTEALTPDERIFSDALKLGCEWGAEDHVAAQASAKALEAEAKGTWVADWDLMSVLGFVKTAKPFEAGRSEWLAFYRAVAAGDGAAVASALQGLEEIMKK